MVAAVQLHTADDCAPVVVAVFMVPSSTGECSTTSGVSDAHMSAR